MVFATCLAEYSTKKKEKYGEKARDGSEGEGSNRVKMERMKVMRGSNTNNGEKPPPSPAPSTSRPPLTEIGSKDGDKGGC